jgi:hypothetical protein
MGKYSKLLRITLETIKQTKTVEHHEPAHEGKAVNKNSVSDTLVKDAAVVLRAVIF